MNHDLLAAVNRLFDSQVREWPLARKNFGELDNVLTRHFDFYGFAVTVQFNPARMVSSGARVDAKTIAERPCFLCRENRPAEQQAVEWRGYDILVNPFPIFRRHFTIARRDHVNQAIKPYLHDMIDLARALAGYAVFYNGPRCGASAPDHAHFQAGEAEFLPLTADYFSMKQSRTTRIMQCGAAEIFMLRDYLRTVCCIEASQPEEIVAAFDVLYKKMQETTGVTGDTEPMMNAVCLFRDCRYHLFVFPRKAFRPQQYGTGAGQLLVSPATVEMSGVFITPVRDHFSSITTADIEDIFRQVSLPYDAILLNDI